MPLQCLWSLLLLLVQEASSPFNVFIYLRFLYEIYIWIVVIALQFCFLFLYLWTVFDTNHAFIVLDIQCLKIEFCICVLVDDQCYSCVVELLCPFK